MPRTKPLPTNLHEALCDLAAGLRYDSADRWLFLLERRGLITFRQNARAMSATGRPRIMRSTIEITPSGRDALAAADAAME